MRQEILPEKGCWVSVLLENGEPRRGLVQKVYPKPDGAQSEILWVKTRDTSVVPVARLRNGFQLGMEVLARTLEGKYHPGGIGVVQQARTLANEDQALVEFAESGERVWLPFQLLVQFKGVRHQFYTGKVTEPADAERLRLRFLAYAIESWNENTGSLAHFDIDPLPHQIHLVHRILRSGTLNWLIADDVGLGKTIETGMLLAALHQRGMLRRVLLLCPAGLTQQWKDELYHKFDLGDFQIYGDDFNISSAREWKMHDFVIGSMDRLKQPDHLEKLMQAEQWDLVIVDEGHRLSRRQYGLKYDSSDRYRLAENLRPRTRNMLLLSATPHQGMQDKFVALLQLLRPELHDKFLTLALNPEVLGHMVYRNYKADVTDAEGNFVFQGKHAQTIQIPASPLYEAFEDALVKYLKAGYAAGSKKGNQGHAIGFVMTIYRKLAASSSAAILGALERRLARLLDENSKQVEDGTSEADSRFFGEQEELMVGSSAEFFAGEIQVLEELIEQARSLVAEDLKLINFVDQFIPQISKDDPNGRLLIFTEYRTTQSYIANALRERWGDDCVDLINGGMNYQERHKAIHHFENEGRFLISTEAGGEGINLQRNCHMMVNYDLPWNPMRLVQRVGRLYRYGQKKKVLVFNLHVEGTLDQDILQLMYQRIDAAVQDMATVQAHEFNDAFKDDLLGEMAELIDVESVLEAAVAEGVERTQERIDEAVKRARTATEKQRELFAHAAGYQKDELENELCITRDHIRAFVEGMFAQLGIEVRERLHKDQVWRIRFPDEVMKELGRPSGVQMDVTLDRVIAVQRPNTHMLDMTSFLLKYLLNKAKSPVFGGHTAVVASNEMTGAAFAAALLRWQNTEGIRMRQAFSAFQVSEHGRVQTNPGELTKWLLRPSDGANIPLKDLPNREWFSELEKSAHEALAQASNLYLHPESLQWIAAGWRVGS